MRDRSVAKDHMIVYIIIRIQCFIRCGMNFEIQLKCLIRHLLIAYVTFVIEPGIRIVRYEFPAYSAPLGMQTLTGLMNWEKEPRDLCLYGIVRYIYVDAMEFTRDTAQLKTN